MHGADVDVLIHYDMCKEEDHEIRNDVCRFPEREDEGRKGIGGFKIRSMAITVQTSCRHGTIDGEGSSVHGW